MLDVDKVLKCFERGETTQWRQLSKRCRLTRHAIHAALKECVRDGLVLRTGECKGTRYALTETGEARACPAGRKAPVPQPASFGTAVPVVIDAGLLHIGELKMLANLPISEYATAQDIPIGHLQLYRHVERLLELGLVEIGPRINRDGSYRHRSRTYRRLHRVIRFEGGKLRFE